MTDKPKLKCSSCGKEIPITTPASENWKYYCPECGLKEVIKEIRESKSYYESPSEIDGLK